jgi:hypothetical protein
MDSPDGVVPTTLNDGCDKQKNTLAILLDTEKVRVSRVGVVKKGG